MSAATLTQHPIDNNLLAGGLRDDPSSSGAVYDKALRGATIVFHHDRSRSAWRPRIITR